MDATPGDDKHETELDDLDAVSELEDVLADV